MWKIPNDLSLWQKILVTALYSFYEVISLSKWASRKLNRAAAEKGLWSWFRQSRWLCRLFLFGLRLIVYILTLVHFASNSIINLNHLMIHFHILSQFELVLFNSLCSDIRFLALTMIILFEGCCGVLFIPNIIIVMQSWCNWLLCLFNREWQGRIHLSPIRLC